MAKSLGSMLKHVPDSTTVPDDGYVLDIVKCEAGTTKTGKKAYKAQLKVSEGKFKGTMLFENFTIGSDDDPDADEQATWDASMGAKQFKRMVEKAGVDITDQDEEDMLAELKGCRVYAVVVEVTQTEGDYKGTTQNRVARNGWYSMDEDHPAAGKPEAKKLSPKKPRASVEEEDDEPAPPKKPKKPPVAEDEDEDEPAKPKKKAPPPDDDDEEEEEPAPKKRRA